MNIRTSPRSETQCQVQAKNRMYTSILPFIRPPSTISPCRNTWSSARRRCPARPKRTVYTRLARSCCPPPVPTCNPTRSRPRNFTVSWSRTAWTYPSRLTTVSCRIRGRPVIPAPSFIRPPCHSRRPGRSRRTTCRICRISCSCSCTTHSCST